MALGVTELVIIAAAGVCVLLFGAGALKNWAKAAREAKDIMEKPNETKA